MGYFWCCDLSGSGGRTKSWLGKNSPKIPVRDGFLSSTLFLHGKNIVHPNLLCSEAPGPRRIFKVIITRGKKKKHFAWVTWRPTRALPPCTVGSVLCPWSPESLWRIPAAFVFCSGLEVTWTHTERLPLFPKTSLTPFFSCSLPASIGEN